MADPDPAFRGELAAALRQRKLEVVELADGALLVERAVSEQPDLIVLEAALEGMSGFQAFTRLREDPRAASLPVMFLTRFEHPRVAEVCKQRGALEYVGKSQSLAHVVEKVQGCLPAVGSRRAVRGESRLDLVYLADRDEGARAALAEALRRRGTTVKEFSSGEELYARTLATDPDLVVIESDLEAIEGAQVYALIQHQRSEKSCVLLRKGTVLQASWNHLEGDEPLTAFAAALREAYPRAAATDTGGVADVRSGGGTSQRAPSTVARRILEGLERRGRRLRGIGPEGSPAALSGTEAPFEA